MLKSVFVSEILDHIAETSIATVDDGWTWKYDPQLFVHDQVEVPPTVQIACPVAYGCAENGLPRTDSWDQEVARFTRGLPLQVLARAHHRMMIDQPLELVAVLREQVAMWS